MNIFIPIAIVFVTMLFIVIRFFNNFKIDSFQAITFNYFAASACAFFVNYTTNVANIDQFANCFKAGLPIGLLFITIFYLMATVTRTIGVAIASIISKMSVVIPIIAGVILYKEQLDVFKIAGILLALFAVYLTSGKSNNNTPTDFKKIGLLVLFFIGSGLVDTSIKYAQVYLMTPQTEDLFIISLFGSAGTIGIIKVGYDFIIKDKNILLKNIFAGVALGLTNYWSLFFVIKALQFPGSKSSITFAIINIGVLLTAALCGLLFFKEKFSRINYVGFLFALIAIVILAF